MIKMFKKYMDFAFAFSAFVTLALVLFSVSSDTYAATAWNVGDVFAGVSNGSYNVYDNTGAFKETITDPQGAGYTTGCSFNNALDKLYTTNFSSSKVNVFDDASPHTGVLANDPTVDSPGVASTESIVFAANGDYYVGHADGTADVVKYNAAGVFQQAYDVPDDNRGSDWIDLAADQTTLFYTSEGRAVQRYDVSTNTPLADFAALPGAGNAFALRLLAPGDGSGGLLVADNSNVKQLDSTGTVVSTYDVTGVDGWFALNLDPDGLHFWAGSFANGTFYKFLIQGAPGNYVDNQVTTVATGSGSFYGLCLKGELTAALPQIILDPPTATNEAGTDHSVTATVTQGGQPVVGTLVSFTVTGGPNTGEVSDPNTGECAANDDCSTDASGKVSWTYTGAGGAGVDTIQACFTDANGDEQCTKATKEWTEPPSLPGRMTGGGSVFMDNSGRVTHGFELHCDTADLPNRLEVNWGKGNKFHLTSLTSALCADGPALDEEQPVAGFDTYKGTGTGRYNGVDGATAQWKFTDDGEPGTGDHVTLEIKDASNVVVLTVSGFLDRGNHQAHAE